MHANKENPVDEARAGHIYAVIGLKDTTTGETLCDPQAPIVLESMTFPEPVIQVAIEPKTKADQEKLVHGDPEARRGGPDLPGQPRRRDRPDDHRRHGRAAPRGAGRTGCAATSRSRPTSASRRSPTARRSAGRCEKHEYTHKKQTGGSGQFAKVHHRRSSRCRPADGALYEFENKVTGGRVPREYIPSVDAGAQDAMQYGVLAGYPLVGIKVTLLDGAYHEVDSSEMAFKIAGSMALKEAARKADPVLLEPMMARRGHHARGLHGRRHRRPELPPWPDPGHGGARPASRVVKALVPLSEMFGYVGDLRSRTQGRANYTHAVRLLRRGPDQRGQGDHREGDGRVSTPAAERAGRARGRTHAPHDLPSARRTTEHQSRRTTSGEGEVRADQAARQHRHHRSHRPRQDHADGGHHQGPARQVPEPQRGLGVRPDRQGARGEGSAASRSRSRTSSTRPRSGTTRTSTAPGTPTTSRT